MFKRWMSLTPVLLIGALTMGMFNANVHASSERYQNEWRANPEKMHEHIKARLDKLANQLKINPSQTQAWEAFSKSVESLADHQTKRPDDNADAAAFAHFRAEKAAEMAKKLSIISNETEKLEAVLSVDQRKILDDASRNIRYGRHGHHHGNATTGC